jgi:60 kDa SS-A/Ro ribonucleoprotein
LKEDTLPTPETWETKISVEGSTKENWESIMPKMGIFAQVRNLRNFLEKGCNMASVINNLRNPEVITKSRMLPFRFFSAYEAVEETDGSFDQSKVLGAISDAIELSIQNVPEFDGNTVVAVDLSGSMEDQLSERSTVSYMDVASVMGAIATKTNPNSIVYGFGQNIEKIALNSSSSVMDIVQKIKGTHVGHRTNGYLVLEDMIAKKIKADRIMLFSDMQLYGGYGYGGSFAALWKKYKKTINPKAKLYSFDLAGYGQSSIPQDEKGTYLLAGWSEKVFDFVKATEKDPTITVKVIKETPL